MLVMPTASSARQIMVMNAVDNIWSHKVPLSIEMAAHSMHFVFKLPVGLLSTHPPSNREHSVVALPCMRPTSLRWSLNPTCSVETLMTGQEHMLLRLPQPTMFMHGHMTNHQDLPACKPRLEAHE